MANINDYRMRAIEWNTWRTIMKLLSDKLPTILPEYNMGGLSVVIAPSYPRDLSDMYKPSIIVRKVDIEQSSIAMGNFIGQLRDDYSTYTDVSGICHNIIMQFDIVSSSNNQSSLLTSIVTEDIMNNAIIVDSGTLQLYDFTGDINNPTVMGSIKMIGTPSIAFDANSNSSVNQNNDYIGIFRQKFMVIQTIIPKQEYVDLSKWMKQSITIKTNQN